VVLAGAEPVLYVERGGRGLRTLVDREDPRLRPALDALAAWVKAGRGRRLSLEKVDGEPVIGHALHDVLVDAGFRQNPTKLTLSA
jgi:ATP-dependent Lhr-like helicase